VFFTAFGFIVLAFSIWRATVPIPKIAAAEESVCAYVNARAAVQLSYSLTRETLEAKRDAILAASLPPKERDRVVRISRQLADNEQRKNQWLHSHPNPDDCAIVTDRVSSSLTSP
jgi:hypothetical protein